MKSTVQCFVMDLASFNFFRVCPDDPLNASFHHERLCKSFTVGDVAATLNVNAAHPKVAQFILVADPNNSCMLTHACFSKHMVNVVDVFECSALASASAMPSADHNGFLFSTLQGFNDDLQFVIGLTGMSCRAHRDCVPMVRTKSLGGTKV